MTEKQLKLLYDVKLAIDEIENAVRIIGLRNQIIHGYYSVSDENIWGIITLHLPKLKSEVNSLINKYPHLNNHE